jgi:peptidoglycan/LPS O-acetylase OafA/YrhL
MSKPAAVAAPGSDRDLVEPAERAASDTTVVVPGAPEHVPALDGFRGLAIFLVAGNHFTHLPPRTEVDRVWITLAWLGWIGVDLFFVLSGFLITGILLEAKGSPHYFRNFYARRILRIFPLYYLVLAVSLFVLPHVLPNDKAQRFASIAGDEIYYWLYLSNFAIARAGQTRHGVLDVTWSLAIEEQFYLVWPAVVLLMSRRSLKRVAIAVMAISLATRVALRLGTNLGSFSIYVLTPCHLDSIAMGSLIAALAREPGGLAPYAVRARHAAWALGPTAITLAFIESRLDPSPFGPGYSPIFNTVGFSLLALVFGGMLVAILTAAPGSRLLWVFNAGWMRALGKYSYGIYLVHLPIGAVIRDRFFGPSTRSKHFVYPSLFGSELPGQLLYYLLAGTAAFSVAWLSFNLFEKHFLKLKRLFPAVTRAR